jgi:hypothetical protein
MIVDVVLVLLLLVAIGFALHYRAKAAASTSASASAIAGISTGLSSELEQLRGDVRAMVDSKFKALGAWLLAELLKTSPPTPVVPPVPDPAPVAATDAVTPSAAAPGTPSTAEPSATAGGTDVVAAKIAEIDATTKALVEHRAKLVAAQEQLAALL